MTDPVKKTIVCVSGDSRPTLIGPVAHFWGEYPMLVKFASLAGGVFIEDNGGFERKPLDRCFRFDAKGNAEYAFFADLIGGNPAPRWYGHQFKESAFVFA